MTLSPHPGGPPGEPESHGLLLRRNQGGPLRSAFFRLQETATISAFDDLSLTLTSQRTKMLPRGPALAISQPCRKRKVYGEGAGISIGRAMTMWKMELSWGEMRGRRRGSFGGATEKREKSRERKEKGESSATGKDLWSRNPHPVEFRDGRSRAPIGQWDSRHP